VIGDDGEVVVEFPLLVVALLLVPVFERWHTNRAVWSTTEPPSRHSNVTGGGGTVRCAGARLAAQWGKAGREGRIGEGGAP